MLLFTEYCSLALLFIEKKQKKEVIPMASRDQQWYMDTRATFHLSSHTGNLHTSSLNRNFHLIIVENGSSIPVTHSGHVQIPNPYHPLHLRNVLVTPNIIKNLVSVRKFTTDNKCSIDFDPYGFTVRDYHTRQTILRCDNTGDLYPFTRCRLSLRPTYYLPFPLSSTSWPPCDVVITHYRHVAFVSIINKNTSTRVVPAVSATNKQNFPSSIFHYCHFSTLNIIHSDLGHLCL
ncbi:hypothetical protein Tco_0579372 [Tanacetum coccineum]